MVREREREREREIVRRSPRCNFLTVSLYDIMIQRKQYILSFAHFKRERSRFLEEQEQNFIVIQNLRPHLRKSENRNLSVTWQLNLSRIREMSMYASR